VGVVALGLHDADAEADRAVGDGKLVGACLSNSSRCASTRALPPRRAINDANTTVLPVPVGRTISGRRTPRSKASSTAAIASSW
jgi:hypothetical protein